MADQYCRKFVNEIFDKWDTDKSNVLTRQQLKNWLKAQMKEKPFRQESSKQGFYQIITGADVNGDGKVDRWELYQFCVNNYRQI